MSKQPSRRAALAAIGALATAPAAGNAHEQPMAPSVVGVGAHAFDFYVGTWDVQNRRLSKALAGAKTWYRFSAVSVARSILGGHGNMDEYHAPARRITGATFRLFDAASGQWSLYWVNARDGILQPPVVGSFVNGRGEFFGDDDLAGRPIKVRYVWSDITAEKCRWEQAFSVDGGAAWETNWIMDFVRRGLR